MLLVTYGCNLRCAYCYEPKKITHKMSFETARDAIIKHLANLPEDCEYVEIQFMGGEPFMEFPFIREVSEWVWHTVDSKIPIHLFAQTNGTLVKGEIRDWLYANRDKFSVALSFDGTSEMQRTNRKSSNIDLEFFAFTWPDQNVKMTISPDTIHNMADGVKSLHTAGFTHIAMDLAMGSQIQWQDKHLKIYQEQLETLVDFYLINPQLEPFSQLRLNVFSALSKIAYKTCSCGEDLVCIDWDGEEYACHLFAPISISQDMAKRSQTIDFSNHDNFISEECNQCVLNSACNRCYGMNYICTGYVSQPSAFHCNAFKLRFAANIRLLYNMSKRENKIDIITNLNHLLESLNI